MVLTHLSEHNNHPAIVDLTAALGLATTRTFPLANRRGTRRSVARLGVLKQIHDQQVYATCDGPHLERKKTSMRSGWK